MMEEKDLETICGKITAIVEQVEAIEDLVVTNHNDYVLREKVGDVMVSLVSLRKHIVGFLL